MRTNYTEPRCDTLISHLTAAHCTAQWKKKYNNIKRKKIFVSIEHLFGFRRFYKYSGSLQGSSDVSQCDVKIRRWGNTPTPSKASVIPSMTHLMMIISWEDTKPRNQNNKFTDHTSPNTDRGGLARLVPNDLVTQPSSLFILLLCYHKNYRHRHHSTTNSYGISSLFDVRCI